MLILSVYGEKYICNRVEKDVDSIKANLSDGKVITFGGITDFSGYSLADEEGNPAEFSSPELDEVTKLQLAIVELYERGLSNG